jgi:hypothetical protein
MYCTFVLFVKQHFPGLPASETQFVDGGTLSEERSRL